MKFSVFVISAISAASNSLAASIESRQDQGPGWLVNVHPKAAPNKCIGVLGGKFIVGSSVDIYDCNGSPTQGWNWGPVPAGGGPSQVFITNPVNSEKFCMDIAPLNGRPGTNNLVNGAKVVLKKCDVSQKFGRPYATGANGAIVYSMTAGAGSLCIDLRNGITTNRNVLQLWSCNEADRTKPFKNQIWTISEH
ncbi:hypothetical protein BDV98DRAFT_653633 [Pterulicium gracile]|uniref:Uncharacterized protein n=1 Tax=Pterulicium gracile TaxID=1884261 RepID=A0A5C3QWK5_9AGAR|nr:hypothetical protein BDV98DRAFT_653633 [Pterula gracilis]